MSYSHGHDSALNRIKKEGSFRHHLRELKKQISLQSMVMPGIIVLIIFAYIPMYGLIMAFQEYRLGDVIGFSEWVGLKHFKAFFQARELGMVLKNTFGISILRLVIAFPFPITLAIILNEVKDGLFKRSVQTISYLPHFVSWVVVGGLAISFLGSDFGLVNKLLQIIGLQPDRKRVV